MPVIGEALLAAQSHRIEKERNFIIDMNQKEVSEIKKRFKPDKDNISRIYGCYVNAAREIVTTLDMSVGLMEQEEAERARRTREEAQAKQQKSTSATTSVTEQQKSTSSGSSVTEQQKPVPEKKEQETKTETENTKQNVSNGQAVVNYAAQFVGNPYVYGGSSLTNGADCSGFVMSVYAAFGISLPHSSSALRSVGYGVSVDQIQPGDIVCYSGHVGIYAGNNTLLHASSPSSGIKYTSPITYREILAVRRIF